MNTKKIFLKLFLAVTFIALFSCQTQKISGIPESKIEIIYTNDIHCSLDSKLNFANVAALKKNLLETTENVVAVDMGDAIQGDILGTISKGEYIVDIMNIAGYDFAVPGNHEFSYGLERFSQLIDEADAEYICCNITYTGNGSSFLEKTQPYAIKNFKGTKVAFVGISTPETMTSTDPNYFKENGEYVYDFGGKDNCMELYERVQLTVDKARSEGASYVIACTHLGVGNSLTTSIEVIENTYGIDAVLDGHSHTVVECETYLNKKGEEVILSQTGSKFANIGHLTINTDGSISTELISDYDEQDDAVLDFIESIKEDSASLLNKVLAHSDIELSTKNENGIRIVRSRETAIGNFCTDAYRFVTGADIAVVNGGGVRKTLPEGDITYADLINVHPFGNTVSCKKVTGAHILDALEHSSRFTLPVEERNGKEAGEFGGFLQCSGIKYTVDTSIPSSVVTDEKGEFVEITGERRVKNVQVLKNGKYEPLQPQEEYTLASIDYILEAGGDGTNMFVNDEYILHSIMSDYQALIIYMENELKGKVSEKYSSVEGRITVE